MDKNRINKSAIFALASMVVIVAILIWTVLFYGKLEDQVPTLDDWANAASIIKQDYKQGDKVAIVPFWASMGEKYFAKADFDYIYLRYVNQEDFTGYKRLWVVSGYDRFVDRDAFAANGNQSEFTSKSGPLNIERFSLKDADTKIFRFYDNLPEAEVFYFSNNKKSPCVGWIKKESIFKCSRAEWQRVGWITQEIGDAVRNTIWSHPVNNTEIHVKFRNVKASQKVVLFSGLTLYSVADKTGQPVFIDVYVDGNKIGRATQPNQKGWHRHELSLENITGNLHDIELVITTERDGRRHFSFNGYVK